MNFWQRIFSSRPAKNELITLKENYARQQQLIANSQQHVSFLLERVKVLENALLIPQSNAVESSDLNPEPTGKELEVLRLFGTKQYISSLDVFEALRYKCKQSASFRISSMAKKGLLKRIGNGRATKYSLPANANN